MRPPFCLSEVQRRGCCGHGGEKKESTLKGRGGVGFGLPFRPSPARDHSSAASPPRERGSLCRQRDGFGGGAGCPAALPLCSSFFFERHPTLLSSPCTLSILCFRQRPPFFPPFPPSVWVPFGETSIGCSRLCDFLCSPPLFPVLLALLSFLASMFSFCLDIVSFFGEKARRFQLFPFCSLFCSSRDPSQGVDSASLCIFRVFSAQMRGCALRT